MADKNQLLRQLPAINVILQTREMQLLIEKYGHPLVAEAAGEVVQKIRESLLLSQDEDSSKFAPEAGLISILEKVAQKVQTKTKPRLRRIINATGIILHTNLGRAIVPKTAVSSLTEVAAGYSNLELDLSTGERGSRYAHVEEILCRLTGAEGALVVNNNAAAVLLVLSTLAKEKEVVVSRGQLVEIGGSFRIPDVMKQSGATLVEVGTTNKTNINDYIRAINENTALLLKVHTSNYKIIGFTAEVSTSELVRTANNKGIPVYEDLGSGVLVDFRKYGFAYEPTVQESISLGVDVVSFSGDKLFGGPQAGIIVGRKDLIELCKKNPLTRALRVDKFTFAALESTLTLYLDEERAIKEIPTLRMITYPYEELLRRIRLSVRKLRTRAGTLARFEVGEGFSQVGGGALPEENIPSPLLAIEPYFASVNWMEQSLRNASVPVMARIQKDQLLIDLRTVLPEEEKDLLNIISGVLEKSAKQNKQEVTS